MPDKEFWYIVRSWTVLRFFFCIAEFTILKLGHTTNLVVDKVILADAITGILAMVLCYVIIHVKIHIIIHYVCLAIIGINLLLVGIFTGAVFYEIFVLRASVIVAFIILLAFFIFYIKTILLIARIR